MKIRFDPDRAARGLGPLLSGLAATWRFEVRGDQWWQQLVTAKSPFVFLLWHETLLPLLWHHRNQDVAIVVSGAQDGRYLASYASRIGYRCLYGSSTRGGMRAFLAAVRALESGCPVAVTPDGPRGPRRSLKPGVIAMARRAGAAVLPIFATVDRAWRLASWDRFLVPMPFSRVIVSYGEPFFVTDRCTAEQQAIAALERLEREGR